MKLSSFLIPGIFITMTVATLSCSKNNGSKPVVSVKSINTPIQPDGQLDADLKFSNGSKLAGGMLLIIRTRINQIPPVNDITASDTLLVQIPSFSADKGEMEYVQPYQGYLHYDDHINDTLVFKFAVIDVDGKSSDTVAAPKIVSLSP